MNALMRRSGGLPVRAAWALPIASCLLFATSCATTKKPTVTACLRVAPQSPAPAGAKKDVPGADEAANFAETQVQAIRSQAVVATALRKPEIAALGIVKARQDPDGWLRQELRVEPSENHDLITVSLSSDEPREAAAVVNAVVHTYLDEVVSAERTMKEARLAELERTYAEMELRLRKSWAEYQRLATASDPEPDPQPITQRAAEARMESMRVQFELSKAKADQQAVHELLEMIKTDPIFDEEYRPIRRDQDEEYIGRRFGNDPKARVRAKRELAEAEARWRAHGKKAADRIRQKAEIQQELKRLAARVQALTDQEKVCKAEVEKWEKELEKLGKASTNVERARADHQALKRLVAAIAEERERLKAELQAPPRVTLVSEAIPPGETE